MKDNKNIIPLSTVHSYVNADLQKSDILNLYNLKRFIYSL